MKTTLTFTDEEIDRFADAIAQRLSNKNDSNILAYSLVRQYDNCVVYYTCDENSKDMFIIKDNEGNIIGKFVEVE